MMRMSAAGTMAARASGSFRRFRQANPRRGVARRCAVRWFPEPEHSGRVQMRQEFLRSGISGARGAGGAILGDGFSDHDLEVRLPPLAVRLAGADIAAIESDSNRSIGWRQLGPCSRGAFNEDGTFLTQFGKAGRAEEHPVDRARYWFRAGLRECQGRPW